jgi:hypothetical protein
MMQVSYPPLQKTFLHQISLVKVALAQFMRYFVVCSPFINAYLFNYFYFIFPWIIVWVLYNTIELGSSNLGDTA